MLGCAEMPRRRVVDPGETGVGAGHGLARSDKVDKLAVHGLGGPPQGCERYRAAFLRIFKLGVGLALHRGLLSNLSLGQADRLAHSAEPAARRDGRCDSRGIQGLDLVFKAAKDDRSDFVSYVVFRLL